MSRRLLRALLVVAIFHFGLSTWHTVRFFSTATERVRFPFACLPNGQIAQLNPEAQAAGLRVGDLVVRVQDSVYSGFAGFREALQAKGPRDPIAVVAMRQGQPIEVTIRPQTYFTEPPTAGDWFVGLAIHVFTPLICLILALLLVFTSGQDGKTELLVLALTAFMAVYPLVGWSVPLFPFALLVSAFAQGTAGYWLFRLGLVFPSNGGLGARPRWLAAALGALVAALLSAKLLADFGLYWGPLPASRSLSLALVGSGLALQFLNVFCALLFAANLIVKAMAASSLDERRRMRILALGSLLGLGPFVTLAGWGIASGHGLFRGIPLWMAEVSLAALAIFPATLAYAVTAHRAMDIRVLLRQAVYYSSLRRSLSVQRILVLCAIFGALALAPSGLGATTGWILSAAFLLAAIAQEFLLKRLGVWLDRKFFRDTYDLDRIVKELRRARDTDPARYLAGMLDLIEHVIPFQKAAIVVTRDGILRPLASKGEVEIPAIDAASLEACVARGLLILDGRQRLDCLSGLTKLAEPPEVLLPLHGSDAMVGVLLLTAKRTGEPYTPTDQAALRAIGEVAGLVLENLLLMSARDSETAERERRKAEAQAASDANRAKSEFLARMSHELRTPLNAIIGYSEMLIEDAEDSGQSEIVGDLAKIRTAGRHLLDLINSVLDISKIEAGKMDVYPESFRVDQLAADVATMLSPLISAKGNRLDIKVGTSVGTMRTDAGKVRQILINLLSNALKFTENGVIALVCARDSNKAIRFEVRDSGIGMTPEQMSRLFQPFQQADASISAKYGGTGLGLTICKKFCELLGGRISVDSAAGVGTTFTVVLPESFGEPALTSTVIPGAGGIGPLVLVIDDDPVVLDLFSRTLSKEGFRAALASNASEGIRLAGELHPDAILLDLMLGGADGISVMAKLRQNSSAHTPVILMSILDESRRGIAHGAEGFLVKPVDRRQLKEALDAVIPMANTFSRALVVDDQPKDRLALRRLLQDQGWRVSEGANSQEGMRIVAREQLAVVLVNLVMPGLDGSAFLAEMEARNKGPKIPVIVVAEKDPGSSMNTDAEAAEHAVRQVMAKLRNKAVDNAQCIAG